VEIVRHPPEHSLEQYAMGTLPGPEIGPLQRHLLICGDCRNRLRETDEYVTAMRAAAAKIRYQELS
jgi:hypothetical protein